MTDKVAELSAGAKGWLSKSRIRKDRYDAAKATMKEYLESQ